MDPYNIKRDNRKKFQDKEKLKRRHATPSDRKYNSLKKAAAAFPPAEAATANTNTETGDACESGTHSDDDMHTKSQPLKSNPYRYNDDIDLAHGGEEVDQQVLSKLKNVLSLREEITTVVPTNTTVSKRLTTKQLLEKDINELNLLLTGSSLSEKDTILSDPSSESKPAKHTPPRIGVPDIKKTAPHNSGQLSHVPCDIKDDESFLDSLL